MGKMGQRGRPDLEVLVAEDARKLAAVRDMLVGTSEVLWHLGQEWYPMQRARCEQWARQTGYSVEQCAAVLAVYSQRQLWNGNLTMARRALFEAEYAGLSTVVAKARAILALDPQHADTAAVRPYLGKSSKVPNFYGSLMLEDCCACDMWMFAAFGLERTESNYPRCERLIRTLAREYGMAARTMQAVIWLAYVATTGRSMESYHPAGKGV